MKNVILFLILALARPLAAQQLTISKPIHLRNDIYYDILGEMGNQTLLFRNRHSSFEIMAFDEQMRESWTKEVELERRSPELLEVVADDAKFTIFYHYRERSHTVLRAEQYNPGANLIDSTVVMDYGPIFYTPNFSTVRSEDRSKTLILFVEKKDLIRAVCFDNNEMAVLWKASLQPEDFNFYQDFRQAIVNNEGNMFLVLERNNYRSRRDDHTFEVFYYAGLESELIKTDVKFPEKLTFDSQFTYDHLNKRLIGAGLYSDKNLGRADGFFYINVNPTAIDDYLVAPTPFDSTFMMNIMGKEGDKTKGLPEAEVREVVLRLDGGVLLIGEKARIFQRNSNGLMRGGMSMPAGRFATDYYYDEIFAISIHPDGKEHWSTVLHKKQYSQDDQGAFSSFFLMRTASSLRFLFNDEIKYENTVSEYSLKGTGRFKRKSILSTHNLKLRLRFRDAVQVGADKVIIPSERRHRLKLVRLKY